MFARSSIGIAWLALGLILVAALPNCPWPMHGDQILFLQGAEAIARGELLYRDFWDLKQPGIIVSYYLWGRAFGFDEWGIHFGEMCFWMGAGLFLAWAWPRVVGTGRASLWPVVTIPVWYNAVTGSMQHAQVETLIGPILFAHWWLLWFPSRTGQGRAWCGFAAGIVAALVLLFKFMFAPLLGVAWAHAWWTQQQRLGWRATWPPLLLYGISLGGTLGVAFGPWVWAYEKSELWRTFIVYPQQMMRDLPAVNPQRLIDSMRWFGARFGPLLPLSGLGAFSLWRLGQRPLLVFVVAWLAVSGGLIYAQKQSWWSYHFMLLLVPLGLLAAEGCRILAGGLVSPRAQVWQRAMLLLLILPMLLALLMKWSIWAKYDFAWREPDRWQYYCGEDPHYQEAVTETAFLQQDTSLQGPIFVAGEPVYYRAARRLPATAVHGWSMELYVDPVRQRLTEELRQSGCVYVFLNRSQSELIAERYPELMIWLRDTFRVRQISNAGTWYERRRFP